MAIPTSAQIFAGVREALGDTEVVGGQVYTDSRQLPVLSRAYQFLIGELSRVNPLSLQRELIVVRNGYHNFISPATISVEEVAKVWVKEITQEYPIADAVYWAETETVDLVLGSTAGLVSGGMVVVTDLDGLSNPAECSGEYVVQVISPTQARLMGIYLPSGGTYTPNLSSLYFAKGEWGEELTKTKGTKGWATGARSRPRYWTQAQNGYKIEAFSEKLLFKMECQISSSLSSASAPLWVNDSENFLVSWVTMYFAAAKGRGELVKLHQDIWGSELTKLKGEAVKNLQIYSSLRTKAYRRKFRVPIAFT